MPNVDAGPDIELAPLRGADPPEIEAAFAAMGWNKPASLYRRYLAEQRRGERDVLLARIAGAFAGYLTIRWAPDYPPFRAAGVPEIQDLNVVAPLRRRGVATRLMDAAEDRIAERGPTAGIGVGLHPGYNAAQRLYPLRGYVPDGRGVTYRLRYVREGESVPFDDDLVLFMTKSVGARARKG